MIYLKDVSWERIHLNLTLTVKEAERVDSLRFYLVSLSGRVETEFAVADNDGETVRLSLNVTNNGLNRCVENDTYRILAYDGKNDPIAVLYEGSFETLSQYGRSFVYDASKGVYSVSFMTDEYSDLPEIGRAHV